MRLRLPIQTIVSLWRDKWKEDDFIVADTTHEIMSLIALRIIPEHWECNLRKDDLEVVVRRIERESENIVQQAIQKTKDHVQSEGRRDKPLDHNFEYDIYDRLHGILTGLASRIMKK